MFPAQSRPSLDRVARRNTITHFTPVWVVTVLVILFFIIGQKTASASIPTGKRVIVNAVDPETSAQLTALGAARLVEYESFALWQLPADSLESLALASPSLDLQPIDDAIYLRGIVIDPSVPSGWTVAAQSEGNCQEQTLGMVQFIGPLQDAWLDILRAEGLTPVSYLPNYAYVVWGNCPQAALAQLAAQHPFIRWSGPYRTEYRLSPELRPLAASTAQEASLTDVTVQLYAHPLAQQTVERLFALAQQVYQPPVTLGAFTTVSVQLPGTVLDDVAAWADVFNIESWDAPLPQDEAQGQLMAGNMTSVNGKTIPIGPGYLAWLSTKGFPTTPASYPIVDVVDDGIDRGSASALHPDFYYQGSRDSASRISYMVNCTLDTTGNNVGGHGNLNAGILGGYNNNTGFPFQDSVGYHYGLGISPFGRLAGTKIFRNYGEASKRFDISGCGSTYAGLVSTSWSRGARLTTNSWGSSTYASVGRYTASAQAYDFLTRDATLLTPDNQEMLHIFSAGNEGHHGWYTVTPPGSAKNVLTVGATEGVREDGTMDRCGHFAADNADDIADFSSRGPTYDGRMKPDIVAPGVHITGLASQDADFNGLLVCGSSGGRYFPAGQTLYTWSSGTSHAAPAVAGTAQLAYEYYQRVIAPGQTPSPAMLKALLLNTTRYLDGQSSGDGLPSPNQGWGAVDMSMTFDTARRYTINQSKLLSESGSQFTVRGGVVDPTKPFRITLVWTDAPGPTVGAAYVNDLDLEVMVDGKTYKGNVFDGPHSRSGGDFDRANNVENVFLPAGTQGAFRVRVIANNIAGDGVPGNVDATDQDFALVIYNGEAGAAPSLEVNGASWSPLSQGATIPSALLPGTEYDLYLHLSNTGSVLATAIKSELKVEKGSASILSGSVQYPDIAPGKSAANRTPFRLSINEAACGQTIELTQTLRYFPDRDVFLPVKLPIGLDWTDTAVYSGPPLLIPDANATGVSLPVALPDSGGMQLDTRDVNAQVNIEHPNTADLTLSLIGPDGAKVILSAHNGLDGDNYTQTVFDDEAAQPIQQGMPPFLGSFRPEQALALFQHRPAAGNWQLNVTDDRQGNSGQITAFAVTLRFVTCDPNYYLTLDRFYLPAISTP